MKKAFDTIDRKIRLSRLHHYGIRVLALDWLHSYLSNRTQFLQINNEKSSISKIAYGVPQGSVLGPKLSNLCINDICSTSNLLKFVLFSDDTNIFNSHQDINVLLSTINNELQQLNTWFAVNKLSLNKDKTHFMLFQIAKILHLV